MKQRSVLWQWAGFAVATFGGTILHFLYDWTGGSILISPFSGVNESTWEHMKLLYWPLFLFALIQRLFFKEEDQSCGDIEDGNVDPVGGFSKHPIVSVKQHRDQDEPQQNPRQLDTPVVFLILEKQPLNQCKKKQRPE